MNKRIIALLLVLILSVNFHYDFVQADDNSSGAIEHSDYWDAYAYYHFGVSPSEVVYQAQLKNDQVYQYLNVIKGRSMSASWTSLPGTFTAYAQNNTTYCGPACIQMAMTYLTGSTQSQATIAAACGTTSDGTALAPMVAYLNANQSSNYYISIYGANQSTMMDYLYSAVYLYHAPAIIGYACSSSSVWPYSSSGHFSCVNAVRSDKQYVQLADPYMSYLGTSMFWQLPASSLYSAYNSVNIGFAY